MIDIYHAPSFAWTLLLAMCLSASALQDCALLFSVWSCQNDKKRKQRVAAEALLAAHGIVLTLMLMGAGPYDYIVAARYLLFAAITAVSIFDIFASKKIGSLAALAIVSATTPIIEKLSYPVFGTVYFAALTAFFLRAVISTALTYRALKGETLVASAEEAMDTLRIGILFADRNRKILLINEQMQSLLKEITGKRLSRGRRIAPLSETDTNDPRIVKSELEGNLIYRLANGETWLFVKTVMGAKDGNCIRITACNVTERWNMTEALKEKNAQLEKQCGELFVTLKNLDAIRRENELLSLKSRVHDLMGQKISILLQMFREGRRPEMDQISAISDDLMLQLKRESGNCDFEAELQEMIGLFSGIGVEISFEGILPDKCDRGRLFIEIIRESVNNAVRHGFAEKIRIAGRNENGRYIMVVGNNGISAADPIDEGSGLREMRRKLEEKGGSLVVDTLPDFRITAVLPSDSGVHEKSQ